MFPVNSYDGLRQRLNGFFNRVYPDEWDDRTRTDRNTVARENAELMVALIFARPESGFVSVEILPNIHYFNERSGDRIDFYFAGFIREDDHNLDMYSDKYKVDASPRSHRSACNRGPVYHDNDSGESPFP